MKEMSVQQVQLLIDYLNKQIDGKRAMADSYRESGNYQCAMVAQAQAAEVDCALAYLMGLLYEEDL